MTSPAEQAIRSALERVPHAGSPWIVWSAFLDEVNPDRLITLLAEIDALRSLSERLKQEAQIHAQEARTANATIAEIYQYVTGATGEPGNWNGARPVREAMDALRADAARYRWLRDIPCNSLSVSRNDGHAPNYMTAREWIDNNPQDFEDDDPADVERMKQTNTIWRLQVYPNTPVGFNLWNGATLDAAIDSAIQGGAPR